MSCVVRWWDVLFVKGMHFSSKNARLLNLRFKRLAKITPILITKITPILITKITPILITKITPILITKITPILITKN